MDTEFKMSVEDLAIMGFDYRSVQLLALDRPWHLMVKEETAKMSTEVEGDLQKPGEKTATISGAGENYLVAEAKDYPVLIDFEKICLWDHDGDLKVGIKMEDPNYMKKRLMKWVQSVVAYVHFLHASADMT
jgi:hypothetical protein